MRAGLQCRRGRVPAGAIAALVLVCAAAGAAAEGAPVSVGDTVRYTRTDGAARQGTVIAATATVMVVAGSFSAWCDTLRQDRLTSLEVRLHSFNMLLGFTGGVVVGALLGSALATIVASGHDEGGDSFAPPAYWVGAPIGALIGGVIGTAYAHDRGGHWKRVALVSGE